MPQERAPQHEILPKDTQLVVIFPQNSRSIIAIDLRHSYDSRPNVTRFQTDFVLDEMMSEIKEVRDQNLRGVENYLPDFKTFAFRRIKDNLEDERPDADYFKKSVYVTIDCGCEHLRENANEYWNLYNLMEESQEDSAPLVSKFENIWEELIEEEAEIMASYEYHRKVVLGDESVSGTTIWERT